MQVSLVPAMDPKILLISMLAMFSIPDGETCSSKNEAIPTGTCKSIKQYSYVDHKFIQKDG